jgi:hypothetical protein
MAAMQRFAPQKGVIVMALWLFKPVRYPGEDINRWASL